ERAGLFLEPGLLLPPVGDRDLDRARGAARRSGRLLVLLARGQQQKQQERESRHSRTSITSKMMGLAAVPGAGTPLDGSRISRYPVAVRDEFAGSTLPAMFAFAVIDEASGRGADRRGLLSAAGLRGADPADSRAPSPL